MPEIIILGAGMIGVTAALELQSRGHGVVVVDRTIPGQETSYGNAGIIQAEAAEPHSLPRDVVTLLRMGLGITNELTWSLPAMLGAVPALLRYYRSSHPARLQQISATYSQLTSRSTDDHAVWIDAAGADNIIARSGFNLVFRNPKAFEGAVRDAARLERTYGVKSRVIDGAQYAREEPAIKHPPVGAIHWQQSWTCSDPGGLTQKYADLFITRGGEILRGDAKTLRENGSGWEVATDAGKITASDIVVALGPWAPEFLKRFGYRIPMLLKRGYHDHFLPQIMPRLPFVDTSSGVLAAPMSRGLRVSSGVSIVRHDAPSNPQQLNRGAKGLLQMMELGDRVEEPQWVGTRPFIPDMLPVVGRAPRHNTMWFNFGHGHQGFTLGPTTAKLLGDAMSRDPSTKELQTQLSPARFAQREKYSRNRHRQHQPEKAR